MRNSPKDKNELKRRMQSRVRTTMIAALAAIENSEIGKLWGQHKMNKNGVYKQDPTEEEEDWLDVWADVRTIILDKGQDQIKKLNSDIQDYRVAGYKYKIKFEEDN